MVAIIDSPAEATHWLGGAVAVGLGAWNRRGFWCLVLRGSAVDAFVLVVIVVVAVVVGLAMVFLER